MAINQIYDRDRGGKRLDYKKWSSKIKKTELVFGGEACYN